MAPRWCGALRSVAAAAAAAVAVLAAAATASPSFPGSTLSFMDGKTGLDGEQIDNIMKLVNKAEQDNLDWAASYGYCQNIGDGRGVTMTIFGATTGGWNDDWPDGPGLFSIFDGRRPRWGA